MKNSADMLASDLRRMAGAIPVGWKAVVLMSLTFVFFPVLITIFVLDALTHDLPALRAPAKRVFQWFVSLMYPQSTASRPTLAPVPVPLQLSKASS